MKNKVFKCYKISVDCCANDPVDVRVGGPEYLGFDFFVKEENKDEMILFVAETINSLEMPLFKVYFSDTALLEERDIWSKERIVETILKEKDFIIDEKKRNHQVLKKIK